MFFYVDESGHTGAHLFDPAQPMLYYGLLSSSINLDIVAEPYLVALRRRLDTKRLHAAQLGCERLDLVADGLIDLQKRFKLRFDFYRVAKPDHAIICFFDQIFDQGMNPAVTWTGYWSPLRYILLLQIASLFDEDLAKCAWAARINLDNATADRALIHICRSLIGRLESLPDDRPRQLIGDALKWTIANPRKISYNVDSKSQIHQLTPNVIGFQSVMHGISGRLRALDRKASRIIVDQQSDFNKAQRALAELYASASGMKMRMGLRMPTNDFRGIPTIPIEFKGGTESACLELVDIYLWIFKRFFEQKRIGEASYPLVKRQLHRGRTNEISLKAIDARWSGWIKSLPKSSEMSEEQLDRALRIYEVEEGRRMEAVRTLSGNYETNLLPVG